MTNKDSHYQGKKVVIFGGLGFMGLNLAKRLLAQNAAVTLVDRSPKVTIKGLVGKAEYWQGDIQDEEFLTKILGGKAILFNLAGRSGAQSSMAEPFADLAVNCAGVLTIMETARKVNPNIKIIFPGSRLEYGSVKKLPVSEDDPMRPTSIYGIHKLTAEKYHLAYHDNFGLKTTVLRISNPYGPHLSQGNANYNIVNYFFDQLFLGNTINIYGDGGQKRDYIFVEDLVDLFLKVGLEEKSNGQVYNVGFGQGISLLEVAETIIKVLGKGGFEKIPWDPKALRLETGDYVSDLTKVKKEIDWSPITDIETGITKTKAARSDPYWEPN